MSVRTRVLHDRIFTALLRFLYLFNLHLGRDPCFEKRWLNLTGYFFRIRNDDVDIFWHCLGFLLFWRFHNQIFLNNCWFYCRREVLLSVTALATRRSFTGFAGKLPSSLDCYLLETSKILEVHLDRNLCFSSMINKTCRVCYFKLHKLNNLRHFSSQDTKLMLVKYYIISRLDYRNSLYSCCP